MLVLVLAGCAATKSASAPEPRSVDGDAASAALHEQATGALSQALKLYLKERTQPSEGLRALLNRIRTQLQPAREAAACASRQAIGSTGSRSQP